MRIFGVVVLYHPPPDLERNIRSYLDAIDQLLVIDNTSPSVINDVQSKLPLGRVQWRANNENEGIAKPWNDAARWAMEQGADWLLVMDQDSFFPENTGATWQQFLANNQVASVAVIAPFHQTDPSQEVKKTPGTTRLNFVMGSGCHINLGAYRASGPFNEKLFLDLVDHEYCLRVRKQGYSVLRMNEVILQHRLGERVNIGTRAAVRHAPIRKYYRSRNRLWVMFNYFFFDPFYFLFEVKSALTDVVKILVLENEKKKNLWYFFLGVWHAVTRKYGRLRS